MRLALDAMGGDHAPAVTIAGALLAAREFSYDIVLVGPEKIIREELAKHKNIGSLPITVVNADEVIGMDENPALAVRQKKNSSMAVAARMVADGKADAFVSAGNSGAAMATSLFTMGRIPGVSRPAITTLFPTLRGMSAVLDVGANVDCKPMHLQQFAIMGKLYYKDVFGVENPKVGLLSIGEEDSKGNELSLATFDLLKKTNDLNFIGNVEGRDIPKGTADVVICDGFVGNIVLKLAEGIGEMMFSLIKNGMKAHPFAWAGIPFLWAALKDIKKRVDPSEYGGAPLLGVDGICIIGHGGSNEKAIKNALRAAARAAQAKVHIDIAEEIKKYGVMDN